MCATASMPFAWQPSPAADAGIAPDLGDRIDAAHRGGELPGLHGLVIARRGRLALERYYPGLDEAWDHPLGRVVFGPETLHDVRSHRRQLQPAGPGADAAQAGARHGIAESDGRLAARRLRRGPGAEPLDPGRTPTRAGGRRPARPTPRVRRRHARPARRHVGCSHDLNHIGQIADVLARQHAEAVGPWRAFLGILG